MRHLTASAPLVLLSALLLGLRVLAGEADPQPEPGYATLSVDVDGLGERECSVRAALWKTAEGFPSDMELAWRETIARTAEAECRVEFSRVPYGSYAISLYQDENGDGELERNFLGIPREPVGVSNNPAARFRPPAFEEARFELDAPIMSLSIQLRGD